MAFILDAVISISTQLVKEEGLMLWGLPDEIRKLQRTLSKISTVLADAEKRRIKENAVGDWLKELKDIMYDADDILDLCNIKADKYTNVSFTDISSGGKSSDAKSCCCCSPFSGYPRLSYFRNPKFAHDIGNRIKNLNLRLEKVNQEKEKFRFDLMLAPLDSRHGMLDQAIYNTSPVVEFDIVGSRIEEDAQYLTDLLTKQDTKSDLLVFAIVGIGGVGKTTLAQKIYDEQKIRDEFIIRMWVSVSQEFTETNLLRDLIIMAGGDPGISQSRSILESKVESMLRERKFFLVLDDVWTDRVWNGLLRNALMSGAPGSRVLVTSRNKGVVNQMNACYCHQVELLPPEEGLLLLCKKAGFRTLKEAEDSGLKDVGMEIVYKCQGLPLAIVAIGRVLSKDKRRSAWEVVLNSSAWSTSGLPNDINEALYLSYLDLPSELKQCFLYCCLLPKNEIMHRFLLVPLWISEGFIKPKGIHF